jgi:polyisoprenyl-phosphate glycosyltransferase
MAIATQLEPTRRPASRPLVSVVLPAHNEAGVVDATLARIAALDGALTDRLEVIVVSDGSTDATFEDARAALRRGLAGRVVELAANAGSHAAIRCGLRYVRGDVVAVMAADGQDPPEALPAMLGRLADGVDVVWGRRRERRHDRVGARVAAAAFYRLFRLLTGRDYPPSGLDFLVARRHVVDAVLRHSARNTSLFLVVYGLGFTQAFVEYDRGQRAGGRSSWTLRKRVKLAVDMLAGCSAAPIRIASLLGVLAGLVGVALGSLMLVAFFMGALILVAIAFLGEYVWRILDEVRGAPPFVEARNAEERRS